MDHLMPGMDGFAAVRVIKSNPQTAMIPVLMYTSQEGELYIGQARSLGAVGVVPKTVKQADVSRVLYQLHLLPDRRENAPPALAPLVEEIAAPGIQDQPPPERVEDRSALAEQFREQQTSMRRLLLANFDSFAKRMVTELKNTTPTPVDAEIPSISDDSVQRNARRNWWIAAGIAAALLPAIVLGVLYLRTLAVNDQLTRSNARLSEVIAGQQQQLAATSTPVPSPGEAAASMRAAFAPDATPALPVQSVEPVPYAELPFSGTRVERLKTVIDRLRSEGFKGVLKVQSYVGDFCLAASGIDSYVAAADDMLVRRCDVVGNPFEDTLNGAERQSVSFANLLATVNRQASTGFKVEVGFAGRRPAVPYPDKSDKLTAGEWNRVAARNNRVEFIADPAG
jgi:CheY-like chemotaxis protein